MLKLYFSLAIVLVNQLAFAQLNEPFIDKKLSPIWQGDTSYFFINSQQQLQSQGPNSGSPITISTYSSRLGNTVWEFWIKLPFSSSTSNYAKIFLSSDNANLKESLHGYFIKIGGESGTIDGIDLYKQNGTTSTKIIDGISGHAGKSTNTLRVKISRDIEGQWIIYSDTTGGHNYLLEGKVVDNSFSSSQYAGIVYYYTSTRKGQFFFDDFTIFQAPLSATNAKAVNEYEIDIFFNNSLINGFVENLEPFILEGVGQPTKVHLINSYTLRLTFPSELKNQWYNIKIKDLTDDEGGLLKSQTLIFHFEKPLKYGDILISEIYSDPTPSNGLPAEEFVELFNTTRDTVNLNSFSYSDASTTVTIHEKIIAPYSYLILTSSDGYSLYKEFGETIVINPWPSLNNSGDRLSLKDSKGNLLHEVNYALDWFKNKEKEDGGWSLEMIHPKEICKEQNNWGSSVSVKGGTPGTSNSIFTNETDIKGPTLISYQLIDSVKLELQFDEPLDTVSTSFSFQCTGNRILKNFFPNKTSILSTWENSFPANNECLIEISTVQDCLGNKSSKDTISVLRTAPPEEMDIVVNEILFNPKVGGIDYVELYNRSKNFIDLKNWSIANTKGDSLNDSKIIINKSYIMRPKSYIVLCSSKEILQNFNKVLFPERVFSLSSMPSFNDDKGTVVICDSSKKQIDRFTYSEDFHSPMLSDKEGVSLERLSFFSPSNNSGNWYSASSTSGYGTPGYENSNQLDNNSSEKEISLSPEVITPNGDNYKDLAYIHYQFEQPGNNCSIKIFNSSGRLIKRLVENQLASTQGFFLWDGTDDRGTVVETGIYIVCLEYFSNSGQSSSYKGTLVVANLN